MSQDEIKALNSLEEHYDFDADMVGLQVVNNAAIKMIAVELRLIRIALEKYVKLACDET